MADRSATGSTAALRGGTAAEIAESVETAIRDGSLAPSDTLPTIRQLAASLQVSPATVASAYRTLRARGLLITAGRRGTHVSARPPVASRTLAPPPAGVRDLASGNPDPSLLPDWSAALSCLQSRQVLYGEAPYDAELLQLARARFDAHGVPSEHVSVVGGALDGIERVLLAHLRPGDRVAVEDPGFTGVLDLLGAVGLNPVGVAVDDEGPLPNALDAALRHGAQALILTPRAQNPTGAALSDDRVRELSKVLRRYADTLLIEDDHAGAASGAVARSLAKGGFARWASVHSVSKTLGPDLRLGVMAMDEGTLGRVEGRQRLGIRWVSHLLQRLVVELWKDDAVTEQVRQAGRVYGARRDALLQALGRHDLVGRGASGFHVWLPVKQEAGPLQALLEAGWAVAAGERFRLASPPGLRITAATLREGEAETLATALGQALAPRAAGAGASDWA